LIQGDSWNEAFFCQAAFFQWAIGPHPEYDFLRYYLEISSNTQTLQYPKYSVFRFRNQKVGIYSKMLDLKVLMAEKAEFFLVGDDDSGPEDA
jgi:hypothetical protein